MRMKKSESGLVWLTKKETEAVTKAFCEVASKTTLRMDQRDVLQDFVKIWFDGYNFKFDDDEGSRFLRLCVAVGVDVTYLKRPGKSGRELPVHFDTTLRKAQSNPDRFMAGSYWVLPTGEVPTLLKAYRNEVLNAWLGRRGMSKAQLIPWSDTMLESLVNEVSELKRVQDADRELIKKLIAEMQEWKGPCYAKPLFSDSAALLF